MTNQNISVDLSQVDNVKCDECQGERFTPVCLIKRLSPLVAPTGKETFIPLQVFKCDECNHINELFLEGMTN